MPREIQFSRLHFSWKNLAQNRGNSCVCTSDYCEFIVVVSHSGEMSSSSSRNNTQRGGPLLGDYLLFYLCLCGKERVYKLCRFGFSRGEWHESRIRPIRGNPRKIIIIALRPKYIIFFQNLILIIDWKIIYTVFFLQFSSKRENYLFI